MDMQCFIDLKLMMVSLRYRICAVSVPGRITWLVPMFLAKVVPFDEIAVYRSDPRHVAKLITRSGGLDVVSMAGARDCDGFWRHFQSRSIRFDRRLVT